MRFRPLAEWLLELNPDWMFYPGPNLPDESGRYVLLTPYGGGGGHTFEQTFEITPWQVRVVGEQGDYDGAESMAQTIDRQFCFLYPSRLDGKAVQRVQRSGGPPYPLTQDEAERTHFVCSYLWEIESALADLPG